MRTESLIPVQAARGVDVVGCAAPELDPAVVDDIQRVWGFHTLRPLQAEAIAAGIAGRDTLVVMPTGGGKSLCYQVPALAAARAGDTRIDERSSGWSAHQRLSRRVTAFRHDQ